MKWLNKTYPEPEYQFREGILVEHILNEKEPMQIVELLNAKGKPAYICRLKNLTQIVFYEVELNQYIK